ncbi:hypothetical protein [Chelativorans sp. AA-79]|uniref:hypothetical protein n=1 Tax=Chelativorans sp. AA-79 TaxID=3028735 RepID=UPI0023FA32FA|nr:hypothetical protein [Chelativorans sp. AA-79]WEX11204.1 hypothetical protein PVE73_09850 [Chelativorans sp. AA-79]
MRSISEDNLKTRLTDRTQLLIAVRKMLDHGIPEEMIPVRLTRAFYVDMDELNSVLDMMKKAGGEPAPKEQEAYKAA